MNPDLSIIVPVYNSSKTLDRLLAEIVAAFSDKSIAFEIIFSNDASSDDSWATIVRLVAQHPFVRGVNLSRNAGQHAATIAGLQQARGRVSITMDDDFEHMPAQIHVLYAALRPPFDMVYAAPDNSSRTGSYIVMADMARLLLALCCRARWLRHMRTFRAMRTDIYPWHTLTVHDRLTIEGLLSARRLEVAAMRVPYGVGVRSFSTYNPGRLLGLMCLIGLGGLLRRPLPPRAPHTPITVSTTQAPHV